MISNKTKSLQVKLIYRPEWESLRTKRTRIDFAFGRCLDGVSLMTTVMEKAIQCIKRNRKMDQPGELRYASLLVEATESIDQKQKWKKILPILNEIIFSSVFGGQIFVQAYQLRSKCHLKLGNYGTAVFDAETAIRFGGLNPERCMLKAIGLFHQNDFVRLKEFLHETIPVLEQADHDQKLKRQFCRLGYGHLTVAYLKNFVSDENFAKKKTADSVSGAGNKPEKEYENENDEEIETKKRQFMEPLSRFESSYRLDLRCKIVSDQHRGRHMVTNDSIPKGTIILAERAYSLVLDRVAQLDTCLYCSKHCADRGGLPCPFCRRAIFCQEECFQLSWNHSHRHECLILPLFDQESLKHGINMYRTVTRFGLHESLNIKTDIDRLMTDPDMQNQAAQANKDIKRFVMDLMAQRFLSETKETKLSEQTEIHFRMMLALADHNEKYESYYDALYMGLAIDVTLLIFLNEYLQNQQLSSATEPNSPRWDSLVHHKQSLWEMLRANHLRPLTEWNMFGQTYEHFAQMVELQLYVIRKLATNVFSWNRYDQDQNKHHVGTCECLVASLVNHSCDPEVEWDFRDGCIIYTLIRDVNAGEEIHNSYGPHYEMDFLERQQLLSNNYYFNCRCRSCQLQVQQYENVLECPGCSGPVVCIPDAVIESDCMKCWRQYDQAAQRMKRVNEQRRCFELLMHCFSDTGTTMDRQRMKLLERLMDTLRYQHFYLYKVNSDLHRNILHTAKILIRFGMWSPAYGWTRTLFRYQPSQRRTLCFLDPPEVDGIDDSQELAEQYRTEMVNTMEQTECAIQALSDADLCFRIGLRSLAMIETANAADDNEHEKENAQRIIFHSYEELKRQINLIDLKTLMKQPPPPPPSSSSSSNLGQQQPLPVEIPDSFADYHELFQEILIRSSEIYHNPPMSLQQPHRG